jgi:dipeptidase E
VSEDKRRAIFYSGGGYHYRGFNGMLADEWILAHSGKERPTVCMLTVPQGDSDREFSLAYKHLGLRAGAEITWAPMFNPLPDNQNAIDNLLGADIIMLPGGYAQGAVGALRAAGWSPVLREAWENGVLLAGMCAGAKVFFQGFANRWMNRPGMGEGLAFFPNSFTAHAQHKLYEPIGNLYRHGVRDGLLASGYQFQDGFMARFAGTDLVECVTTEPHNARGWFIEPTLAEDGMPSIIEHELASESLESRLRLEVPIESEEFTLLARSMDAADRRKLLLRPLDKTQDPQEDGEERVTRSTHTPDTGSLEQLPGEAGAANADEVIEETGV